MRGIVAIGATGGFIRAVAERRHRILNGRRYRSLAGQAAARRRLRGHSVRNEERGGDNTKTNNTAA